MESFGKYLLLERLAAGGMAEVYLAKSTGANGINKFVAIKRILPQYSDNPDFVDMFKEEAKIAVNLNHSNIVSIYDFGIEKHQFFLVMEFVEGQNLRQILNHIKKETKELSIDQIVYVVKEVAAGLDHAHRCLDGTTGRPLNITHRDMSPQNVMISFEGEVKVVDFGIAKAETQMEHTRAGTIKGKFGYMSPEQSEGQPVDPRTDIFSLGIVLWELLAKDRLFTGQNEAATLRKVRECQIPSLRKINSNIPPELERICMKALAKDKSLRYQTAAAFHKDLNRFLNTQFPEFSTQEFSKFMKSLYHKMYLENRRKLAEYAKISASVPEEKSTETATGTVTGTRSTTGLEAAPEAVIEESLDLDVHSKRISLDKLKSEEKTNRTRVVPVVAAAGTRSPHLTNSGVRAGTQSRITRGSSVRPPWGWLSLALVLAISAAAVFSNRDEIGKMWQTWVVTPFAPPPPQIATNNGIQTYEVSSKQIIPLNIQSRPQGAVVYINGQNVGVTPFIGHIESSSQFQLTLRKEGYLPYIRPVEKTGTGIYKLEATLQPEPPMAYVSIEVIGGGADPVVTVNNQRLDDKSQLGRYPIPAGVPVVIRAANPFAKLSAEETVTVGQGQKKAVRLILGRQAGKTH